MNAEDLRSVQASLKEHYRESPEAALITLRAQGRIGGGLSCKIETGKALVVAGLHPATGGSGLDACSGDMLLEALVACAGVTLNAVATALGIELRDASLQAEGDLDFRGTLGVPKDATVGFKNIRLQFTLDTDASEEQLGTLLRLTERYCVVYQTLANPPAFGGHSQTRNRASASMIFEQIATGGCQSYLLGCSETCAAVVIDPEASQIDRYLGLAARDGLRIHYLIDTHTHADHFSGTRQLARKLGVPVVMHRESPAPFVDMRLDDGDMILVGHLRLRVIHTPGHTRDSMCLQVEDHLFTGDTLLFGGTGRTDLPTGDPEALYDSLFGRILQLEPALKVHPAHDYKGGVQSTIAHELAENPRLQKRDRAAFVEMMRSLNLSMPTHITEALRSNMSGGKTVAQLLAEAASVVPFMSLAELKARVEAADENLIVLDVRERDTYENGHIPRARLLPRGQLELRVNDDLPDPTRRIVACCEFGRISTLAAATLRELGYQRAVALDGGVKAWREAGYPLKPGSEP